MIWVTFRENLRLEILPDLQESQMPHQGPPQIARLPTENKSIKVVKFTIRITLSLQVVFPSPTPLMTDTMTANAGCVEEGLVSRPMSLPTP